MCNDKYVKEIDEAVKIQNQKQEQLAKKGNGDRVDHFERKDANIYVYDKDKIIILAYKPLSNDDEVHYYAYDFSDNVYHISKILIRDDIINNMMRIIMKKI